MTSRDIATNEPRAVERVQQQKRAANIHVVNGITVGEFVAMRIARDATLGPPALIILPFNQTSVPVFFWRLNPTA